MGLLDAQLGMESGVMLLVRLSIVFFTKHHWQRNLLMMEAVSMVLLFVTLVRHHKDFNFSSLAF
jgi:hypothetical protein